MPFGQLVVREVAKLPAVFVFFGLLWATRFFTPVEARAIKVAGGAAAGSRRPRRGRRPGRAAGGRGAAAGRGERSA